MIATPPWLSSALEFGSGGAGGDRGGLRGRPARGPPGGGQSPGDGALTTATVVGGAWRAASVFGGAFVQFVVVVVLARSIEAIDASLHHIGRLEHHDQTRLDRHLDTGLGVAPNTRRAVVQRETAKTTDLNTITSRERLRHLLEHGLNCQLNIFR
jgi:hypothetical protein